MAFSGQVLDNPVSGERFIFRTTAADSDGELLAFDLKLSPDGHVPGAHVHPSQEETFEVVEGTLEIRKGIRTVTARSGDRVIVPAGTVHRFKNAGDGPATVRVEVRPALRMEELFETAVALAREGRTTARGMPLPMELAVFMREFAAEVRAPFVPPSIVRAVLAPLAWLGQRRGLDSRYLGPSGRGPRSRRDSRRPGQPRRQLRRERRQGRETR